MKVLTNVGNKVGAWVGLRVGIFVVPLKIGDKVGLEVGDCTSPKIETRLCCEKFDVECNATNTDVYLPCWGTE